MKARVWHPTEGSVEVKAYPIEVEGFPNIVVHRPVVETKVSKQYWVLSELTTRLRVCITNEPRLTVSQAIDYFTRQLRYVNAERFAEAVKENSLQTDTP
jgi:hypothetical protein